MSDPRIQALEAHTAALEACIVDLQTRLLRLERHTHNTSPSHHGTGGPIVGSIR